MRAVVPGSTTEGENDIWKPLGRTIPLIVIGTPAPTLRSKVARTTCWDVPTGQKSLSGSKVADELEKAQLGVGVGVGMVTVVVGAAGRFAFPPQAASRTRRVAASRLYRPLNRRIFVARRTFGPRDRPLRQLARVIFTEFIAASTQLKVRRPARFHVTGPGLTAAEHDIVPFAADIRGLEPDAITLTGLRAKPKRLEAEGHRLSVGVLIPDHGAVEEVGSGPPDFGLRQFQLRTKNRCLGSTLAGTRWGEATRGAAGSDWARGGAGHRRGGRSRRRSGSDGRRRCRHRRARLRAALRLTGSEKAHADERHRCKRPAPSLTGLHGLSRVYSIADRWWHGRRPSGAHQRFHHGAFPVEKWPEFVFPA